MATNHVSGLRPKWDPIDAQTIWLKDSHKKSDGHLKVVHVKATMQSAYLREQRITRVGLLTNKKYTWLIQLTVQIKRKRQSNVKLVVDVPVNNAYPCILSTLPCN